MKFTLEITMGNEGMSSNEDVADVLHNVSTDVLTGRTQARIMDLNGNSVGHWEFTEE